MKIEKVTVLNYKTLENLEISINTFYTAICGKNNAGKSSLIQVIKNILGYEGGPFDDFSDYEINFKEDFTIWKQNRKESISFCIVIRLYNNLDVGLIRFIETFVKNDEISGSNDKDSYLLRISMRFTEEKASEEIEIEFEEKRLDDYSTREVLSKIRNSKTLIFHDSTVIRRNYGRYHGYYDDFSQSERESVKRKSLILQKEFKKISERHKKDLTDLLGRLNEKYDINLTVPGFNFERIPYEISLGEKGFDIPLDNWGSGTRNRTLILKSLFNAKKFLETADTSLKIAPVVLIEEPESFLHPSAQAEFGKLLQDLAGEFEIQIITTTHSPFLLSSLDDPTSNILLERRSNKKIFRETIKVNSEGENWKKPFALALGIEGPEFDEIRSVFFSQSNKILLVEGDTDKEYFEMLRSDEHGVNKLNFNGEIYAYGGCGTLNNSVMLKFLKEKYSKLIITFDLDAYDTVKSTLTSLGMENEKDFFKIGLDKPGKRSIEGLLPEAIFKKVWESNSSLVHQTQSDRKDEAKSAKFELKKLYIKEFRKSSKISEEFYSEFYKLVSRLNKILKG